ncbi:S9 family peptidase [Paenibacillus filicis]|uniref:S9 family peptidase n=1 Tax=Paenibacillus filicis TaxID=669464 RepID=A0ABU9DGB5_9BACL
MKGAELSMLQSTDLARITLFGAPAVHPLKREEVVLAKASMNIENDGYISRLTVWDTKTHTETPLLAESGEGQPPALDHSPKWSPDGSLLAFIRKVEGSDELWLYRPESGAVLALAPGRKVKDFVWAPDGGSIVFISRVNEINTTAYAVKRMRYKLDGEGMTNGYTHLFEIGLESGEVKQITELESDHGNPAFSPDGKQLYFSVDFPGEDDRHKNPHIHVRDRASGSITTIDPEVKSISALIPLENGSLLGTGKETTPNSAEFDRWFIVRQNGKAVWLEGNIDVPLGYHIIGDSKRTGLNTVAAYHVASGTIVFAGTSEGRQSLYRLDTAMLHIAELPLSLNVHAFDVEHCDERETAVVFVGDAMDRLGELYRAVWQGESAAVVERITYDNEELLRQAPAVAIGELSHRTPDGWIVQGWTLERKDAEAAAPRAGTILMIHGGPHLAYGHSFHYDFWYLASRGYRIVFCNPRGSYGYGQAFSYGVVGQWGGKDVDDILGFLETAGTEKDEPIYVMGGSYGGYLVNWLIGHDHRFKAAVTERSICNLYSKIGSSDLGFQINLYELGGRTDLWNGEEHIMERSPIRYAERVTTPVLILHGEQDHRCPIEQGEQWFQALKRLGKQVEFIRFPGASHAMASSGKPRQRIARLDAVANWFQRNG